jgi:hypothetical protein
MAITGWLLGAHAVGFGRLLSLGSPSHGQEINGESGGSEMTIPERSRHCNPGCLGRPVSQIASLKISKIRSLRISGSCFEKIE